MTRYIDNLYSDNGKRYLSPIFIYLRMSIVSSLLSSKYESHRILQQMSHGKYSPGTT
ncbi:predicted protein [Sclerotinia sclerotiorum 1980 UF-70]|uniref:Uncharacterized protein n=1 Tax=Sclerotinia sclerotiorum (strain ATCC 18683 / 1980 / Ss-1) TaxID=665079 RepID=A7EZD6_SCLS1|nr:predicted protein [Sclerotinia sclerotiorum 1980 UF-70]EDN94828.1 predicted protein [Sclerotinia sclerotiorum 1980 UF-70]